MNEENIIPDQEQGIETNTESSIELNSEEEAKVFFATVKERLFSINRWQDYAGAAAAHFQLTDREGNAVERKPQQGDHFKIHIPAPGTVTGSGNDWVQVEAIDEEENYTGIRVRPATNPTNDRKEVAHFFDDTATSSFIIKRMGNKIIAGVYGRNEKPNTRTGKFVDKIRNTAIATGAIAGFSKLQWKTLVNGFVSRD